MRDFKESVMFEKRMGAKIIPAAFQENPLHVTPAGLLFDFRDHVAAKPGRSLRRIDREVGERRKADATGNGPFHYRRTDQSVVVRPCNQKTGPVIQIAQILDEPVFEIAIPSGAVVAQAALDFTVAYISGVRSNRTGEEMRDRFGGGGFAIPSENSARITGPRNGGATVAFLAVLVSQSPISVHCM
jgi:hypothetical protein